MGNLTIRGEKVKRKGEWFLLAFSILLLSFSAIFFLKTQYPSFFESVSSIDKKEEISPHETITINFSKPVIPSYFGWNVKITPQINFSYRLENNNKKLVIIPEKYWNPESLYQINISGRNYFLSSIDNYFSFRTILYPKITEFYPTDGSKDVQLDIEDPIRANFDSSVSDFNVKFAINPSVDVDFKTDGDSNQINLMPKSDLEKGKRYSIEAYVKYKEEGEGKFKKIGETIFDTKSLAPVEWDKNFNARIEQAKKFTGAQITEGKYIDINLKSQVMVTFENGKVLDAYMVSTGKRGMETPVGTYHIANKTPRAWSKEYGLFMPYWNALVPSGKFGIHELPEWPGGYKEGAAHLGTPVSHGCVRLGVGPAKIVYDWAGIGTAVVVHY
jgi:lipoprotein-anchoring transpeptidase ErfK/SrfK